MPRLLLEMVAEIPDVVRGDRSDLRDYPLDLVCGEAVSAGEGAKLGGQNNLFS